MRLLRPARIHGHPLDFDWALALGLSAVAQLECWVGTGPAQHRVGTALLALAATTSVAVRRRYPGAVGIAVTLVFAFQLGWWGDPQIVASSVAYLCVLYGASVWTSQRGFALVCGVFVAAGLASAAAPAGQLRSAVPFTVVALVVMLIVRRVVGDRERRAQLAERERDVAAREAVIDERARIARELHDAIAHDVSMMVMQAGAERHQLEEVGGSAHEVLATIEHIGRGALTEMRRFVGMLRSDPSDPLTPQPSLGDVPRLVEQARDAGLPVELRLEGNIGDVPLGIGLTAYRIVQEALTNALKHAGAARVSVTVRRGARSLELEIVDDGLGVRSPVAGGGHGLVGMRERVALYGGRLDAGRGLSGGFAVRVELPLR